MEICIGLCMMAMFSPIVLSTLQLPRCQCPPFVTASGVKTARAAFPPRKSVMTSRTVTTDPMNISAVSHSTAPIVVVTTNLSLALLHFVCSSTIKPTPPEKNSPPHRRTEMQPFFFRNLDHEISRVKQNCFSWRYVLNTRHDWHVSLLVGSVPVMMI